jgi:heme exporter protein B
MSTLRLIALLVAKDLRAEARSWQTLGLLIVIGLLIVTVLGITGEGGRGSAALWTAYLFSGALCFERTMAVERRDDALAALILSPLTRGAMYAAKAATNLCMLLALVAIVTPVGLVFFGMSLRCTPATAAAALLLSMVGYAAAGTLFSAVSTRGSGPAGLVPLLVFPLTLPLVIASASLLDGRGGSLPILIAFDLIFIAGGWLASELLLEPRGAS